MNYTERRAIADDVVAIKQRIVCAINADASELPEYQDGRKGEAMDGVRRVTDVLVIHDLDSAAEGLRLLADLEEDNEGKSPEAVAGRAAFAMMTLVAMYGKDTLEQFGVSFDRPRGE